MSKSASVALLNHFAQGTTTRAICWKCVRKDGLIFCFTSVDVPLFFDGLNYQSYSGFTPSSIESKIDLSVNNLEVVGVLDSESITERDLLAGLWDGCNVEIFEVNYRDLNQGKMILSTGTIGNVSAGRNSFNAELRGLSQKLQQPVGGLYTKSCSATFGDNKCKYDSESLRVSSSVSAVTSRALFQTPLAGASDYYGAGVVSWVTGLNAGLKMEVATFSAGLFNLSAAMPFNVSVSDTFTVTPGCRKRRDEDCKNKWNNVINFRGFPDTPLNDIILGRGNF